MSTELLLKTQTDQEAETDADKAVDVVLAAFDLGAIHPVVKGMIRRAYLLGRFHQASQNFDNVIKHCRREARS